MLSTFLWAWWKVERHLLTSSQLAFIHFSHITFLTLACGVWNAGSTQAPLCSLPYDSPSCYEMTCSLPTVVFNSWSDVSIAVLFDRVIWMFSVCLCVFISAFFDVVSFKAAKANIAGFFFVFCDISETVYFALSFVCSVYVGALCVLCVCVLIIAFSHQISTKRGQVGTVPINLLIIDHPEPTPPICETQNTPRVDLSNQTLCPPSQDVWDMTVTSSLYPLFPFRKKNSPNIQIFGRKDNIGNVAS